MRYLQGGVTYFTCLLTEDCAEQSFLSGQIGLTLRGNLTNQDISGTNLCADTDNTAIIQILQCIFTDTRDITCDLFRAQLGVTRFDLVFLDMYGGIYIFLYQALAQKYGILVVVTFPGHKADQRVLTKAKFAVGSGRTVCDHLSCLYMITGIYDRSLVVAVGLVGTYKLLQRIFHLLAVIRFDTDALAGYLFYRTGFLCKYAYTGVYGSLGFHTGSYHRRFRKQQRYCLTLHVGSHQRTVSIVVLQERDECRSYGEYHLRRHVHIIEHGLRIFLGLCPVTAGNGVSYEMSLLVQLLVCLCYMVIIFFIRSHINYFIRNDRILRIGLVDLTIRCFDETILVDPCIGCQRVDQTDIRTFRGLDRAHTSVMCIVYVSYFETCTVSGKTARSQCGKTTLVCQFTQRVVLIHKLGQLGGSEEFLHGSLYRLDVDQGLRGNILACVCIVRGHTLTYHTLHTGQTDTVLVLQQLTYCTDTTVAQVVDIIRTSDTVSQCHHIVDGCQDIALGDVLRDQIQHIFLDSCLDTIRLCTVLTQQLLQYRPVYLFIDAKCLRVHIQPLFDVYHQVGDNLYILLLSLDHDILYRRVLDHICQFHIYLGSCSSDGLAGERIQYILCQHVAHDTIHIRKLLIELETAYLCQIITSRVKEGCGHVALCALHGKRLTRTYLVVQFLQAFFIALAAVLLKGLCDQGFVAEEIDDLFIGPQTDGTQKYGDRHLSVTVNTNIEDLLVVRFILQPCTSIRNHLCKEVGVTCFLVFLDVIVNTR